MDKAVISVDRRMWGRPANRRYRGRVIREYSILMATNTLRRTVIKDFAGLS